MRKRLKSSVRAAVMTLIAGLLLPANAYALAPEPAQPQPPNRILAGLETGFKAGFDVVLLRPLGLITMAVGAAAFVPVGLMAAPAGRDGIQPALELFVLEPAKSVFQRPLGDF